MSQGVKHCGCGQVNAEHDAFCARCGQPIFDVVAVTTELREPEAKPESAPDSVVPVAAASRKKSTPLCGTMNEFFALLCGGTGCGNDLSAVLPSRGTPSANKAAARVAHAARRPMVRHCCGVRAKHHAARRPRAAARHAALADRRAHVEDVHAVRGEVEGDRGQVTESDATRAREGGGFVDSGETRRYVHHT